MDKRGKADRSFRRKLREELASWRAEGLISDEQAGEFERRYALSELAGEGTRLLVASIYTIGAILIAGGVISFVAAHWESIPRPARVALIFAAMLAAHVGGYVLWHVRGTRPTLGHALVMLGTLIYGANIGLMAQMYHIRSHFYNGFLAWAVGAAVAAYCLSSVPNAAIAVATSFIWFCGWTMDHFNSLSWYPLALLAAGLPLAYFKRSAVLFFLVLLGFGLSAPLTVGAASEQSRQVVLAGAAVGLLLTGYGAFHATLVPRGEVASTALVFGGLSLAVSSYFLSFLLAAERAVEPTWVPAYTPANGEVGGVLGMIAIVFCAGVVLAAVSGKKVLSSAPLRPYVVAVWAGVLLMLIAAGYLRHRVPAAVLSNVAFFVLAAGLVWSGVASLSRKVFWIGVMLIALQILSRFLEYETGLLAKSAAFLASGAAVIWGGVKFERLLRRKEARRE